MWQYKITVRTINGEIFSVQVDKNEIQKLKENNDIKILQIYDNHKQEIVEM